MERRNQKILEQIQHKIDYILSQLDRDPFSKTGGSFDRLFWGWKLKDYPDATLQRLVFPLTYYYYNIDSSLCDEEQFLTWMIKSFEYLEKIQHQDGSFDQAFPNEHSHGATAFLLHDCAHTYGIIRNKLDNVLKDRIEQTLRKMGDYLTRHDEEHGFISNHLLGAASGLQMLYILTKEGRYEHRSRFYIDKVISKQSPEGWFVEYGGADPGYQTLAIYYMAQYYAQTKDGPVLESLEKAIEFISFFLHPDGSFGGEYGSRNTEIFYPGGVALVQRVVPLAGSILEFVTHSIEKARTVNLDSVDIGNIAPLINNYLTAFIRTRNEGKVDGGLIPFRRSPFVKEFKDAGIVVFNGESNYAAIGISKGGVIKEYDKKNSVKFRDDCGYIGVLKSGEMVSTQNLCKPLYDLNLDKLVVYADFYEIIQPIPDPYKFLIFRIFSLVLGNIHWLREAVKRLLVRSLLTNSKRAKFKLVREVSWTSPLTVQDTIKPEGAEDEFVYLKYGVKFSTIHMASAKYWHRQ